MATTIRLTVMTGPHKNRKFCFCGPTRCQVGRALECFVQLSGTERDGLISRHHCQLDINPPLVQIGDLGSSNGTYINGKPVEPSRHPTAIFLGPEYPGAAVNDGDILTIGGTTFKVDVVDCPHTANDEKGQPIWELGETAKKDCPLPCEGIYGAVSADL
jgi:eukaryotic-like serine/threonine-protein kinase